MVRLHKNLTGETNGTDGGHHNLDEIYYACRTIGVNNSSLD